MCKSVTLQKEEKYIAEKSYRKEFWIVCPWWHSQSSEDQKSIISGDARAEADLLMRLFWTHLQLTHLPSLRPLSCFCHFLGVDTLLSYIFNLLQTTASFLQSRLFLSLLFMCFRSNDHCLAQKIFLYDLSPINRPRLEAHCALTLPLHLGCSFQLVLCRKASTLTVSTSVLRYSYQTPFTSLLGFFLWIAVAL